MRPFTARCKVVKVVDGDTLDVITDLGWNIRYRVRVRLEGVDTPELRPPYRWFENEDERLEHIIEAREAKESVAAWVSKWQVRSHNIVPNEFPFWLYSSELDKYGRSVGTIGYHDEIDDKWSFVTDMLKAEGYGTS